jgi:hypothetical protein
MMQTGDSKGTQEIDSLKTKFVSMIAPLRES